MIIFDFPISGGSFVTQCSTLKMILSLSCKPDICTAASGGNIPAYLGCMSQWNPDTVYSDIEELSSDAIATKRYSNSIINWIVCILHHNAMYDRGRGIKPIMERKRHNIKATEIWTNCTRRSDNSPRLFCNMSETSSICKPVDYVQKPVYADGNIDLISEYCAASCTIPSILKDVKIDGKLYVDSGLTSASCMSQLIQSTKKSSWSNSKVFIFSPYGLDFDKGIRKTSTKSPFNLLSTVISSIDSIVHTIYVKDRTIILGTLFNDVSYIEIPLSSVDRDTLHGLLDKPYALVLEIIHIHTVKICITDFDHVSVSNAIDSISVQDCILRLYYEKGCSIKMSI